MKKLVLALQILAACGIGVLYGLLYAWGWIISN